MSCRVDRLNNQEIPGEITFLIIPITNFLKFIV